MHINLVWYDTTNIFSTDLNGFITKRIMEKDYEKTDHMSINDTATAIATA